MSMAKTSSTQPSLPLSGGAGPSWQSRLVVGLLRLLGIKRRMASAVAVQDYVRRLAERPASYEPTGLGRGVVCALASFEGWPVYHTAAAANPDAGNYVLFLHGGGYIKEIVRAHWRIVGHLTREGGARCVVPIYPLAPHGTAKEVVPTVGRLLRELVKKAGPAKVVVVGNSAGAGLGLAAAQWLRANGGGQPDGLVLISPGINALVADRRAIAADDPVQDIPGLLEAARLYAGELDLAHAYVSPLNGDFSGIAPIIAFSGTRDLLYPDSIELAREASAAGVPVELHLKKDQPHNYAGLPTPEGREARAILLRAVKHGLACGST
jgi:epsilon-lactone hydrolase